jgi:hypothetical protein
MDAYGLEKLTAGRGPIVSHHPPLPTEAPCQFSIRQSSILATFPAEHQAPCIANTCWMLRSGTQTQVKSTCEKQEKEKHGGTIIANIVLLTETTLLALLPMAPQ